jgi:hypothetical protein
MCWLGTTQKCNACTPGVSPKSHRWIMAPGPRQPTAPILTQYIIKIASAKKSTFQI